MELLFLKFRISIYFEGFKDIRLITILLFIEFKKYLFLIYLVILIRTYYNKWIGAIVNLLECNLVFRTQKLFKHLIWNLSTEPI